MSEPLRVAIVAEGPTDLPILVAAIDAIDGEIVPRFLQPPGDSIDATTPGGNAGPLGGGWKGVRRWCQQARGSAQWDEALRSNDLVVIHVDADVASDPEVAVAAPCPPAGDTVDALRPVILAWVGPPADARCVLCVPSKASDAWLAAALELSPSAALECDMNPALLLKNAPGRPKAVSGHTPNKHAAGYRRLGAEVATRWSSVRAICSQAARFDAEVRAAVSSLPPR